jgi:hypothetical protein
MEERTQTRASEHSRPLAVRGAGALVASVLVNVGLVLVAGAVGLAPGFRPLSVPPVAFLSAVGAVGATGVYWGLTRYRDAADRSFVRLAAVVLVLSFLPDVGLLLNDPAATVAGVVALMVMHAVVAAASVGSLVYWGAVR